MKNDVLIRFAKEKDLDELLYLFKEHASFEKAEFIIEDKKVRLKEFLFSESSFLHCFVVELDSKLIGYATYFKQFSTWDVNFYVYMDCLFLKESSRGLGIGKKLMNIIKEESLKLGCNSIQWQTPTFNKKAIQFYNRIGANSKDKKRFFLSI